MTVTLCPVPAAALEQLPSRTDDKSGVGVHYVDAASTVSVKYAIDNVTCDWN